MVLTKGRNLNATLQLKENTLQLQVAVADVAYPITIDPWLVEDQVLSPSDGAMYFGGTIRISGDTVVVGGSYESSYVFTHNGTTWSEQAKLPPGVAAISGDTIMVGASSVFTRSGNTWSEQAKLPLASPHDSTADISGDTVVVWSRVSDLLTIFIRNGTTWSEQATLTVSGSEDFVGNRLSVAISGDTIIVGAPMDDEQGEDSGVAYVFTRSNGIWNEQARLTDSSYPQEGDEFGASVDISGNTVVVGSPGVDFVTEEDNGNQIIFEDAGMATFFVRDGTTWSEQGSVGGSSIGDSVGGFGQVVSISGDTAIVKALQSSPTDVFIRTKGSWGAQSILKFSNGHLVDSVAVVSDDTVVVGSWVMDKAYVFDLSSNTTTPLPENQWRQIILPGDPGVNNSVANVFGDDISGAYGEDWILFRYDTDSDSYVELKSTDTLSQGVGYWIIHKNESGDAIVLDLPKNSTPTPVTNPTGCLATAKGCFEIPLATEESRVQWNMISYPFDSAESLGDVRILTDSGTCASGCELDAAASQGIVHNKLWTYNGTGYTMVDTSGNLDPWTGYWVATLDSAEGNNPRLLVPKPLPSRVPSD